MLMLLPVYFPLFVLSALEVWALYAEDLFLPDLFISMLPYLLAINFFLLFVLFIFSIKRFSQVIFNFTDLSFILLIIATVLMGLRLFNFSLITPVQAGVGETPVKVAFFNKLNINQSYEEMNNQIKILDPDILGIAEMTEEDLENLNLENYPYHFSKHVRYDIHIAIYSKYKTTVDQSINETGTILPLKMQIDETEYQVFLLHPLPPVSNDWAKARNADLKALEKYITSENVIVLGDFNVSPWSKTYRSLISNTKLKDTALGQGVSFTWGNKFIKTQIDHILVSSNANVESFKSEKVVGSDHNLIYSEIKI